MIVFSRLSHSHSYQIAEIVLSEKVLDDSDRLRSTILHEMCNSAAWLVDGERKPPHGPEFRKWASISSAAIPGMLVSTCHNYVIHKPYRFMCQECKHIYGRHSKKGVDLERQCCGICKGRLAYMGVFDNNGKVCKQSSLFYCLSALYTYRGLPDNRHNLNP